MREHATSSLSPLLEIGNVFATTHPHFANHGISEVVYLGDHATRSRNFHLIGSFTPSNITGKPKAVNFSKRKIELGLLDKHFTYTHKVKVVQKMDNPKHPRKVLISSEVVEDEPKSPEVIPTPIETPIVSEVTGSLPLHAEQQISSGSNLWK